MNAFWNLVSFLFINDIGCFVFASILGMTFIRYTNARSHHKETKVTINAMNKQNGKEKINVTYWRRKRKRDTWRASRNAMTNGNCFVCVIVEHFDQCQIPSLFDFGCSSCMFFFLYPSKDKYFVVIFPIDKYFHVCFKDYNCFLFCYFLVSLCRLRKNYNMGQDAWNIYSMTNWMCCIIHRIRITIAIIELLLLNVIVLTLKSIVNLAVLRHVLANLPKERINGMESGQGNLKSIHLLPACRVQNKMQFLWNNWSQRQRQLHARWLGQQRYFNAIACPLK